MVYQDSVNGDSVNYIKNVEYVGKRIWVDANSNQRRDAGEVTNHAYTPIDDAIINWRSGDIGAPDVGAYYFDITASQYVTTINAPALIDRFIANKKAYPVLSADKVTLDLPASFDLSKVIDYNSSYGVFMNAGSGSHQITGTAYNDFFVVGANGSNVIDGGANQGYYKYPLNTATGSTLAARDSVRITEETSDLNTATFVSAKYSLIKVSDWVKSQTGVLAAGNPVVVQDVLNQRELGSVETDWIESVSDILATQLGSDPANSSDFLLVKTTGVGEDRKVLGMDLLKNIERLEWRFWNDVNGDGRQGGGTAGYWGEVTSSAALSLELKPNFTVLEAGDQAYASTAGKSYTAVANGTSFADTINLQTVLTGLNASVIADGMGVKFTDLGGDDVVSGSNGNDLFYLSGGNDVLNGGQGASDRALAYWAPDTTNNTATLKVAKTDTSIVFTQTQAGNDVKLLELTKSVNGGGDAVWTLSEHASQIRGFNNGTSLGTDQLTGIEQFVIAINSGVNTAKVTLTGLSGETVSGGFLIVDLS